MPLPTELLSHILDLAISPSRAVSGYREDKQLLAACCLVSKRLCEIAGPKLRSVVHVRADARPSILAETGVEDVRVLDVRGKPSRTATMTFSAVEVAGWIRAMPKLAEVRLEWMQVDEQVMLALQAVQHIRLRHLEILTSSSLVLNNRVTLTLDIWMPSDAPASPHSTHPFFSPTSSIPSLRALRTSSRDDSGRLAESMGFLPKQLDMLQIPGHLAKAVSPTLHARPYPVLLNLEVNNLSSMFGTEDHLLTKFQHWQINADLDLYDPARGPQRLKALETTVRRHTALKSLSRPHALLPKTVVKGYMAAQTKSILRDCADRGIEVIWRPHPKTPEDDHGVSREFWAYAKGLKNKKAVEAAGASE